MKNERPAIGPRDAEEELIFAAERLRTSVQRTIHRLLRQKGISQHELGRRLGVTDACVSQYFGDDCNLTIRLLARIFHALGEECALTVVSERLAGNAPSMRPAGEWAQKGVACSSQADPVVDAPPPAFVPPDRSSLPAPRRARRAADAHRQVSDREYEWSDPPSITDAGKIVAA